MWVFLTTACTSDEQAAFHPLRRLNNAEYANTLRDLLYIDAPDVTSFPPDSAGTTGYDNDASALTISPLLVERYAKTTEVVLGEVFDLRAEVRSTIRIEAEGPGPGYEGGYAVPSGYAFADAGSLSIALPVEDDGAYRIGVLAMGAPSDGAPPQIAVSVDGSVVGTAEVSTEPAEFDVYAELGDGTALVNIRFANPAPSGARQLTLDAVTIEGPLDPETGPSPSHDLLIGWCDPVAAGERACAEQVLTTFIPRAWRRPLRDGDLDWALAMYDEARGMAVAHEGALRASFELVLLSEDFVFRLEGPPPAVPSPVDPYALAVRLSYFLWSTMPDDELFGAASDGSLSDPAALAQQAERMLSDPRSSTLVSRFAAQWLGVQHLGEITAPDLALRDAMEVELQLMLADHILGDAPIEDLLTRDTTYVNAQLAAHYALTSTGPAEEWSEAPLEATSRRGVLTTAAFLLAHSHEDQPSTVARGKWIVEHVLCADMPPPPPLTTPPEFDITGLSARQIEEAQRQAPGTTCAGCHAQVDPWGHALGLYDELGALRSIDELGFPIDTRIVVSEGTFGSILDAVSTLAEDPRFLECLAGDTWRYALGRAPAPVEESAVLASVATLQRSRSFRDLILEVVWSSPFRSSAPAEVL